MNNMTPEAAKKIAKFQDHFYNFDWSHRDSFGKDFMALMRECLEAGGFDFENLEHIDVFMNEIIEPKWLECGRREKELIGQIHDEFRKAGATEAQITWQMFENVPVTRRQAKRINRLSERLEQLHEEMFPLMGLAAVLNEARAELTA